MKLNGENIIQASRIQVWDALNDPGVLKETIPGAQSVDQSSDDEFKAVVEIKIGPVKAKFTGKINLSDVNPPNGYKIIGQGQGGAAGFAKGSAVVTLTELDPETTKLVYEVDAQVGGKLAQVGQRLIQSASKSLADQFFNNLQEYFNGDSDDIEDKQPAPELGPPARNVFFFNSQRKRIIFALVVFLLSFIYFYNN
ncbi:MAG: carbon monoxide dehydrogenase [Rhodobiaceae bacterium]|nr:carbon monoxide dehydrogenase [Rhodobiaceae bacterium]|tara:strand:+ start:5908 stop:6495 length:588 start_codon:yes stop_codon:yes gene_type:complete